MPGEGEGRGFGHPSTNLMVMLPKVTPNATMGNAFLSDKITVCFRLVSRVR